MQEGAASFGFCCLISKVAGGHTVFLLKDLGKVGKGVEARIIANVRDGKVGILDQMVCIIQPQILNIFMEGHAQSGDKQPTEVLGRVVQGICYIGDGNGLAEMLLNDQVITREEYNKIDTIMTQKYAISSSTIFSNMR